MSTIERAIEIAAREFAGIVDKGGNPYIFHLLRVGMAGETEEEQIVGVLHDLKEDRNWTREQILAEGFSPEIADAIESVSRRPGENYMDFVRRAYQNRIGRPVKRRDLKDNLNLSRIPVPSEKDLSQCRKYRQAVALMDSLDQAQR